MIEVSDIMKLFAPILCFKRKVKKPIILTQNTRIISIGEIPQHLIKKVTKKGNVISSHASSVKPTTPL